MAATLTMSGGGQEDPFYPLQKASLPAGFPLEESALFGLDCKITEADKAAQNDYTQVNRLETKPTFHIIVMYFIEWAWQIRCRPRLLLGVFFFFFCWPSNFNRPRCVMLNITLFCTICGNQASRLRPAGRETELLRLQTHSPHVFYASQLVTSCWSPLTIIPR